MGTQSFSLESRQVHGIAQTRWAMEVRAELSCPPRNNIDESEGCYIEYKKAALLEERHSSLC